MIYSKEIFLRNHKESILKFSFLLIISVLVSTLGFVSLAHALDPGWKLLRAPLVSPEAAREILKDRGRMETMGLTLGSETEITPEIQEQARALQNDPKLIYEFVRNHVEYIPYYGCLKGATLTLMERSGNDFDQAALIIALLRSSGYSAQFVYGEMTIPNFGGTDNYDMQRWLGIDANSDIISEVLGNGGIPATVYSTITVMNRVWVKATIDSSDYLFDPAFKPSNEILGIDLESAMGYSRSELLSAAGGEIGATMYGT